MVLISKGVNVEDVSPPPGPTTAINVSSIRVNPISTPRAPHSYMQRSVFGDEPFEFRAIDPSTVDQPIGPLETAPGVLAPTVTGRPATKPSSHPAAESWDHFLYRLALATTKDLGARPYQISDFPPDSPPRSVEPDYSHLLSSRDSVETVHPQSQSTVEESVAVDVPPSSVDELSFSAIPMAPASRRRSSVVEVRAARQSSVKIAQATKSARLLGSISGPIRSKRTARGRRPETDRAEFLSSGVYSLLFPVLDYLRVISGQGGNRATWDRIGIEKFKNTYSHAESKSAGYMRKDIVRSGSPTARVANDNILDRTSRVNDSEDAYSSLSSFLRRRWECGPGLTSTCTRLYTELGYRYGLSPFRTFDCTRIGTQARIDTYYQLAGHIGGDSTSCILEEFVGGQSNTSIARHKVPLVSTLLSEERHRL
ncbi:hypothetical protein CPB85DRAFT_1541382 [Mucidula mucida]|nr:hypothetical protein CPB85DRAFT_1541382 [Mucidula mucida]